MVNVLAATGQRTDSLARTRLRHSHLYTDIKICFEMKKTWVYDTDGKIMRSPLGDSGEANSCHCNARDVIRVKLFMTNAAVQKTSAGLRTVADLRGMFVTLSLDDSYHGHLRTVMGGWLAQKEIKGCFDSLLR